MLTKSLVCGFSFLLSLTLLFYSNPGQNVSATGGGSTSIFSLDRNSPGFDPGSIFRDTEPAPGNLNPPILWQRVSVMTLDENIFGLAGGNVDNIDAL